MFKRSALGLSVIVIGLGFVFMLLDILDIAEGFRLHWPIAILNTVFIGAVAIFILGFGARNYLANGSLEMLSLGCCACAFGVGILLYGWLNTELNPRIVAYDSGFIFASIIIIAGACLMMAGRTKIESSSKRKPTALVIAYLGVIAVIVLATWLAFQGYIIYIDAMLWGISIRDIIQGIAEILYAVSAIIYIRIYLSKSRLDVHYWYFLGLILIACGIFFISRGPLEGRIAWLGRLSQYTGCIFFLVSTFYARKLGKSKLTTHRENT